MTMTKTASLNATARLVSDRMPMSSVGLLTPCGYPPTPTITGCYQTNSANHEGRPDMTPAAVEIPRSGV
jgi:hypothetical protein